jgi:hypothetical protein
VGACQRAQTVAVNQIFSACQRLQLTSLPASTACKKWCRGARHGAPPRAHFMSRAVTSNLPSHGQPLSLSTETFYEPFPTGLSGLSRT